MKVFHKTETFGIQYFTCNDPILLRAEYTLCSILLDKRRNVQGKYFCSATGGADSGPASLEGTPTDDKNGQQAFSAGKFCDINMDILFSEDRWPCTGVRGITLSAIYIIVTRD